MSAPMGEVNTSPEFKGIKTHTVDQGAQLRQVNTSPEFKGIKTAALSASSASVDK